MLLKNSVGLFYFILKIAIFMKDIKFLFKNQNPKLTLLNIIEKQFIKYSKWFSQLG
jgi:hypothetical protein